MADVSMVAAANTNGNAGKNRVFVCAAPVDGLKFFQLPHPRSGDATQFASATDGTLLEVNRLADASHPHSWLLAGAERVEQDGSLYVATPVDPLFVLLPRLRERGGGYFKALSDVFGADSPDDASGRALETHVVALPRLLERLRVVCDVNDKYDEPMLRLNEANLTKWLQRKARALEAHLRETKQQTESVAATDMSQFGDENAGAAGPSSDAGKDQFLAAAAAWVAEYLEPAMVDQLCKALGVTADAVELQRKGRPKVETAPAAKWAPPGRSWAAAGASGGPADEAPPPAKKPKPAAPKAKAAALGGLPLKKGQKTMAAFFGK